MRHNAFHMKLQKVLKPKLVLEETFAMQYHAENKVPVKNYFVFWLDGFADSISSA